MIFETVSRCLMGMALGLSAFLSGGAGVSLGGGAVLAGGAAQTAQANCTVEMLSSAEGVDFRPYLHNVYGAVKKRWIASARPLVEKGEKGIDVVEVRILRDGSVPEEFLKIRNESGKSELDAASLEGVREAAPFGALPEKFTRPFVELRFTFYYNLMPQR